MVNPQIFRLFFSTFLIISNIPRFLLTVATTSKHLMRMRAQRCQLTKTVLEMAVDLNFDSFDSRIS